MIRTLVFAGDPALAWLRLGSDGAVMARGSGTPPALAEASETIAVVPGDAVVIHWVELPPLAPAQAAAAARLLAADVSAAPIDSVHVAIGPRDLDGGAPLALVDRAAMAGWLAQLAAAGIDPDRIVPAPLLLAPPAEGVAVIAGDSWTVRGPRLAFAAEAGLAAQLIGDAAITPVDTAMFEAGLGAVLAGPLLDLRQGDFARPRRWQFDPAQLRRAALLAAGIAAALLATEVAGLLRHGFAADRAELQLDDAARAALPRGTIVTDPRGQVAARLASLGGGSGFTAPAGPLLAALRDHPAATLRSLAFAPDTGLVAGVAGPAADAEAIAAALVAAGLAATAAPGRDPGVTELTVRAR